MRKLLFFCTLLFPCFESNAQTVGLFQNTPSSFNGYTLFSHFLGKNTYLIDNCGKEVHTWKGNFSNSRTPAHLLPDGTLIRSGNDPNNPVFGPSAGGLFEKMDWNGNILWSYQISDGAQAAHHDFTVMPNGNLLVVVWQSMSSAELIAHGRNPANIGASFWADKIVELAPVGPDSATIVWEWNSWDHFIQDYSSTSLDYGQVPDHPELIDINLIPASVGSWMHVNSIDYNAELDQIIFSVRNFNELMVIDHSTTTTEAAGHSGGKRNRGGDILYRWGNPANYRLGTSADKKLYQQHDAHWIKPGLHRAGQIMVFNNGVSRPGGIYSTVEIIQPPLLPDSSYDLLSHQSYGPVSSSWVYPSQPDTAFYSATMGGAIIQPNGNILICEANTGELVEVDSAGTMVWKYVSPLNPVGVLTQGQTGNNGVFKIMRYDPNYTGFSGQMLVPGIPLETNPLPYICSLYVINDVQDVSNNSDAIIAYPNPSSGLINISVAGKQASKWSVRLMDVSGRTINSQSYTTKEGRNVLQMNLSDFAPGCYLLEASGPERQLKQIIVLN